MPAELAPDGLEIALEDPRWARAGLPALAAAAASAALAHEGITPEECELSVLGCDDARIAVLNAEFRGKPAATNVLSWPAQDLAPDAPGGAPEPPRADAFGAIPLGDVAISYDTCEREAAAQGIAFEAHCTHLLVHGILHLLGYDHVRDQDATVMEGLEARILGSMGLPDPYGER